MNISKSPETCDMNRKKLIEQELFKCLQKAGEDLYLYDQDLILKEDIQDFHAYERSICFRYGIYLNRYIEKNKMLKKYNLDAEYNRDLDEYKRLPRWENGCYPDLILHKRGTNDSNLLIVECKGWWTSEKKRKTDREKIKEFIYSERYSYMYGVQIIFERDQLKMQWFKKEE